MIIDAHAHLTSQENPELESLLTRANEAGIEAIINICCDAQDLERGLALAKRASRPKIYTVASITPHDAAKEMNLFIANIAQAAKEGHLVAIGETGLDYYYFHATKEEQQKSLRLFFEMARVANLPLVIHCRDAFEDLFKILDEETKRTGFYPKVMLHCFTGTLVEAKEALKRGWHLSFSGLVTYPKNKELQEVAAQVPLDRFFLETDSPYLAPQKYRGRTNEPSYLIETAKFLAALRNLPVEELVIASSANTRQFFSFHK